MVMCLEDAFTRWRRRKQIYVLICKGKSTFFDALFNGDVPWLTQ